MEAGYAADTPHGSVALIAQQAENSMIKIWGRRSSSNVQAVLWGLHELGLQYERVDAGFTYGVVKTPEYLSMNPNATVPTLKDGDHPVVWESGAILRYLAKRYGSSPFWPDDLIAQTLVDQWAEWSKINIALNFTSPVFWRVVRTAPSKQDPAAIDGALTVLNEKLAIAEQQLSGSSYLCGEELTLADIQLGHSLYRYFDIDITRPSWPAIESYYERLKRRQSFQDTVMFSYEELRVIDQDDVKR